MSGFKKASRAEQFLRMAIQGASGSGKTRSALEIAKYLAGPDGTIALIDTEKSASLYSDVVDFDVDDDFGTIGKESYHQDVWKKKAIAAAGAGYKVLVLDSATHLWKGPGGFLSQIDTICANQRAKGGKGDSFAAWKIVDPAYMSFMQFIRALPMHVIFCIRAKTEYERTTDGKGGLKKVGMAPEYRDNYEYEFDIQAAIDMDHVLVPLKHRLGECLDGKVFPKPGKDFAEVCLGWLNSGAASAAKAAIEAEAAVKINIDVPLGASREEVLSAIKTVVAEEAARGVQIDVKETTTVTVQQDASNDISPETTREPEQDIAKPPVVEGLLNKIIAAASKDELKLVGGEIKKAVKAKEVSDADYAALATAYSARNKAVAA